MSSDDDQHAHRREKKDDRPGRWQDLILSTEEAEGGTFSQQAVEQITQHQHEAPHREKEQKKKRKSRGNRQLQRFRAKLKRQGLNNETIATLITEYNHLSREYMHEREESSVVNVNIKDFVTLHEQVGINSCFILFILFFS